MDTEYAPIKTVAAIKENGPIAGHTARGPDIYPTARNELVYGNEDFPLVLTVALNLRPAKDLTSQIRFNFKPVACSATVTCAGEARRTRITTSDTRCDDGQLLRRSGRKLRIAVRRADYEAVACDIEARGLQVLTETCVIYPEQLLPS